MAGMSAQGTLRWRIIAASAAATATVFAIARVTRRAAAISEENARPQLKPSSGESIEERNERIGQKFRAQDGITFYFFPRSPCARRVWLTLLEKGIKFNSVMVNLMQGEQRHPSYLAINPQGKVPAIRVQNVPGISDVCLYESQAIVEWLDEAPFPSSVLLKDHAEISMRSLYPSDPTKRMEVKMWQYWELSLAEEFWPLSRQQVDGTIWRWTYTWPQFQRKVKQWSNGDPFYEAKATKMYQGKFLSEGAVRRSILRILRGVAMLEAAVKEANVQVSGVGLKHGGRVRWLVGDEFSQADIAVYPRLVKAPQNGILSTPGQRALFPNVLALFSQLARRQAFAKFRWRDNVIWSSGVFPRFAQELGWWGWILPWSAIIYIGNWHSGIKFHRFTLSDFKDEVKATLQDKSLKAIPRDVAPRDEAPVLYYSTELPMSAAVQVMVSEMNIPGLIFRRVETLTLQQLSPEFLRLNPFGELPVLVHQGRAIYGPHIIIEFLIDAYPNNAIAQYLLRPLASSADAHLYRAKVRRWFGWVRTAYYYQLLHIWEAVWWGPTLRDCFPDESALLEALPSTKGREEDAVSALEAYRHAGNHTGKHEKTASAESTSASIESESSLLASVKPYVDELRPRIAYVEKELEENGGSFLCGGEDASYADIFVLPIVLLCAKYTAMAVTSLSDSRMDSEACAVTSADVLAEFPRTKAWVFALQQRGGAHGACAKLMDEMVCLHGRPHIRQISQRYGYDYELVGEGDDKIVYDPFIRNDALQVLRKHYVSRPGDIFVATYPKAGTTWLQTVISLLLNEGDKSKVSPHPVLQQQAPWLDASFLRGPVKKLAGPRPYIDWHILEDLVAAGVHPLAETKQAKDSPALRRRVFKTHATWSLFPVSKENLHRDTKIVVVARNVKDVAVSLFKHSTKIPAHNYTGPWDDFLSMFLAGNVCEGSWFDHTIGWWQAYNQDPQGKKQIFWIPFEELKADPITWIRKLAAFLNIDISEEKLSKVVESSEFGNMAAATAKVGGNSAEATSRFTAGGGQKGKWANHFSREESSRVDEIYNVRIPSEAPGLKFDFGLNPYN